MSRVKIFTKKPVTYSKGYSADKLSVERKSFERIEKVNKVLSEANYPKSKKLVFLSEKEFNNFLKFSEKYKFEIKSGKYKFLEPKITSTIVEILKELSAYHDISNSKKSVSLFNNFLDVYNVYKKFNPKKEPPKQLFTLMFNECYKINPDLARLKKIIVLRYS